MRALLLSGLLSFAMVSTAFADGLKCDMTQYKESAGLTASLAQDVLEVTWAGQNGTDVRARYAIDNGIAVHTLTETRRTLYFMVVGPDSADPGLPSDPIPLDANHFGIASPASRASEVYVHVRGFLDAALPPRAR